ncbi:MAG TPA: hypothetical protein VE863_06615 [Pyrinomonadaceae bacterium]|jgi:hypothetical protein|nr:hypothetical protein [Pyrinomonadaceae bacterium]
MRALSLAHGLLIFSITAFVLALPANTSAQDLKVRIKVLPESRHALIDVQTAPRFDWSFRDTYANVIGLGSRIEKFQLFGEKGDLIASQRLAPGQFKSQIAASNFKYEVNLSPPVLPADAAFVSWVTKERGLLMLADLLPVPPVTNRTTSASVTIETTGLESILSSQAKDAVGSYQVSDVARAVFALGEHLRVTSVTESGSAFDLVADGDWAFADGEVIDLAGQILKAHRQVSGVMPGKHLRLVLFPFPQSAGGNQWTAETRGETVTLLVGKLPSKVAALAQLSTPLTHEFFHLWVPNALALDGDYDWFYEGFTMYEAAQVGVRLNLLTFQEFLNAIARANDAYLNDPARDRWSLVEASRRRWTGGTSSIYSKSMLVAMMTDLKLRESGNKRGLDDVYRQLFAKYAQGQFEKSQSQDGNDRIIDLLKSERALPTIGATITEPTTIDLRRELLAYGLVVENSGVRTRVTVAESLTKRQRDLLAELGYNAATHSPK